MGLESMNDHSPWWARIMAILFGLIVLGSAVNIFYMEYFGVAGINHYSFGNEPEEPGDYQQNASSEEQAEYNRSLQEWDEFLSYQSMIDEFEEANVKEISQIFAALSIIIGIPTIAFFWVQDKKMLHFGIAFGVVKLIGDVLNAYISSDIIAQYMESVPGGADYSWLAKTSVFSSGCCGIFFIAIAVVVSNMYHATRDIPESGFHLNVNLTSNLEQE
ncbi:MAG: hypothetical protein CMB16_02615 [Euryarchaeota archaeon]|nr:hypothetical protein [Euryarchaeota archaeon]